MELSRGHPYGVSPVGNLWASSHAGVAKAESVRMSGLGPGLGLLEDKFLLSRICPYLEGDSLARLSRASRFAYAIAHYEELWRNIVLRKHGGDFSYRGSWKETYTRAQGSSVRHNPVHCNVYSDVLYQPFWCSASKFPSRWTEFDNVAREDAQALTVEDFITKYELPNRPVILQNSLSRWSAFTGEGAQAWSREYLLEKAGSSLFNAGGVAFSLDRYYRYADQTTDDNPLYLFDKHFVKNTPQFGEDYQPLPYFSKERDLFEVLDGTGYRPDHRWLIIGPRRSGSRFHVDPNGTSAWNAVVDGAKKWIMFPPSVVPPGVHPSEDGGDVTSPVSLVEWFRGFYDVAREDPKYRAHMLECVCRAGDTIWVPSGYWHLVVNLEFSVAVTQNYVSTSNLQNTLNFLARSPKHVSGLPHEKRPRLREKFLEALRIHRPMAFKLCEQVVKRTSNNCPGQKRKNGGLLVCNHWHKTMNGTQSNEAAKKQKRGDTTTTYSQSENTTKSKNAKHHVSSNLNDGFGSVPEEAQNFRFSFF